MEEIAEVYARSLFEVAKEHDVLDRVHDELGEFAEALEEDRSLQVFLHGQQIFTPDDRGETVFDDTFLVLFHAAPENITMTLPEARWGAAWYRVFDTDRGFAAREGEDRVGADVDDAAHPRGEVHPEERVLRIRHRVHEAADELSPGLQPQVLAPEGHDPRRVRPAGGAGHAIGLQPGADHDPVGLEPAAVGQRHGAVQRRHLRAGQHLAIGAMQDKRRTVLRQRNRRQEVSAAEPQSVFLQLQRLHHFGVQPVQQMGD